MKSSDSAPDETQSSDYASQAESQSPSIVREIWDMLRYKQKWWLIPILLVLLVAVLSRTVFASFIHTSF
jgi:hypothetical protein